LHSNFSLKKNLSISAACCLLSLGLFAQFPQFSIATDLGVLRSFKKEQRFLTFGHTIQGQFHLTSKDAFYVWLSYYANGKFKNDLTAMAKAGSTIPAEIDYTNKAEMRFRQFSVGWKKYLKGNYAIEEGYNIYGYAGLGIVFGRSINNHSVAIDTALYDLPVLSGERAFKRLTLDLGLGWEVPIGNAIFIYAEGRAWIPTTDYPSKYLYVNNNAPVTGMFNVGMRILFD
jgi:hypothetical protein